MTIDISKLHHETAKRYKSAPTVRDVIQRIGGLEEIDWQMAYEKKYPLNRRNVRNQRIFEADHRVEIGSPYTEAPFLTDHHLKNARSTGSSCIHQIFQEPRMNLPGGTKIKSLHKRVRSIPEGLRDRVDPAMHIARKEIDPEGVFVAEYDRLQVSHEVAIDNVINRYRTTLASFKMAAAAKKLLRDETIKELERVARAHWIEFEDWFSKAQSYLTGDYLCDSMQP